MSIQNAWSETLCDCTNDCGICCYGYWCTPCLFGSNAKKIDDKNCCLMCCAYTVLANFYLCWIPHLFERQNLRKKYNLKEEPCGDIPVTLCCSPCALCQEAREIKARENKQGIGFQPQNNAPTIMQQPQQPQQYMDPNRM